MKKMLQKFDQKTVAVTGACGFIGSHLTEELLKTNVKKIICIDSLEYGTRNNVSLKDNRLKFHKFRLGSDNPKKLSAILKDVDFLFHLAAEKYNQSKDDPQRVLDANITGTYQLFSAAAKAGVQKIVFSSSLYAYGRMAKPKFKETDLPEPDTLYGISKLAGEKMLRHIEKQYKVKYAVLRYMFAYGPRQYSNLGYKSVIVSNFKKILNNEQPTIYGDGKQTLDYIYVKDVVAGTISAMMSSVSGEVFNIGTGQEISVNKLTAVMLKVANSGLRPIHAAADRTAGSYRVADINKANNILKFKAKTSLPEGLKQTLAWLKQ